MSGLGCANRRAFFLAARAKFRVQRGMTTTASGFGLALLTAAACSAHAPAATVGSSMPTPHEPAAPAPAPAPPIAPTDPAQATGPAHPLTEQEVAASALDAERKALAPAACHAPAHALDADGTRLFTSFVDEQLQAIDYARYQALAPAARTAYASAPPAIRDAGMIDFSTIGSWLAQFPNGKLFLITPVVAKMQPHFAVVQVPALDGNHAPTTMNAMLDLKEVRQLGVGAKSAFVVSYGSGAWGHEGHVMPMWGGGATYCVVKQASGWRVYPIGGEAIS